MPAYIGQKEYAIFVTGIHNLKSPPLALSYSMRTNSKLIHHSHSKPNRNNI